MSIADAQRIIVLENRVDDLAARYRGMIAHVAVLEDHLVDFQAALEARQRRELSAAAQSRPKN